MNLLGRRHLRLGVLQFVLAGALTALLAIDAAPESFLGEPITINDASPATPYPSSVQALGVPTVSKVTVTLSNLTHTYPSDIMVLLVGPAGQTVMLMSGAGFNFPVNDVTLTFDDGAASSLPAAQIVSGTFRPTSYVCCVSLPSPAPGGPLPYGAALSVFNGTNPDGVWNLYVFDDVLGDIGSIGSWTLDITTTVPSLVVYGLTADPPGAQRILTFRADVPGTILSSRLITGLQPGESLLGIDVRPATGDLYALASTSRLYVIDPTTGGAAAIGLPFAPALAGGGFGIDFSPVTDRIRVVSDSGQNLRLDPNTGLVAGTDTPLAFRPGDPLVGLRPAMRASAHSSNPMASLSGIASVFAGDLELTRVLVTQGGPGGPNDGQLSTVAELFNTATAVEGFDISPDGLALASVTEPLSVLLVSNLYTVNLATAQPTLVGMIGTCCTAPLILGIAAAAPRLEVTLAGSGSGHVSSTPGGIHCRSDCRQVYALGTVVTLSAVPAPGSIFAGWAGACIGFDPCRVTVETATAVIATFQPPADPVPFRQPTQIGVSDAGTPPPTSSYPSIIAVQEPAVTAAVNVVGRGRIRKLTVTLNGVTHPHPADLDILLEGPTGQTVLLMSDAGSGYPVVGANITFDDSAPALPNLDPLRSGTYQPTNHGRIGDLVFPAPAPFGPYATQLSAFNGTNPNGLWKLYVRDDLAGQTGTIVRGWTLTIATGPTASTVHDLDGDGKADVAIYRKATGEWFVRRSFDGRVLVTAFGAPALEDLKDLPVPADYDGDGIADIAVFRQSTGQWFVSRSSDGQLFTVPFGGLPDLGDVPVPGDYDGDGVADLAVYRKTTGQWFIFGSTRGFPGPFPFGAPWLGDIAVPADYDGDGKMDVAIYRPTTGEWFVFGSATGQIGPIPFGAPQLGDLPVPADFDGDGRADFAVYRRTTGQWIIYGSSTGIRAPVAFGYPPYGDVPAPADYDGDGKADLAIYRQINGDWILYGSATGFQHFTFGLPKLDDILTLRQAAPPEDKPDERPDVPPKEEVPEEVKVRPPRPAPVCRSDPESFLPPEC